MATLADTFSKYLVVVSASLVLTTGLLGQAMSSNASAEAHGASGEPAATKVHDDCFVIGNDDVLSVSVWKEPEISKSVPVRWDGKISLPLIGEVQAAGSTPLKLEQEIAARLKIYISEPEMTVMVQQVFQPRFTKLSNHIQLRKYSCCSQSRAICVAFCSLSTR